MKTVKALICITLILALTLSLVACPLQQVKVGLKNEFEQSTQAPCATSANGHLDLFDDSVTAESANAGSDPDGEISDTVPFVKENIEDRAYELFDWEKEEPTEITEDTVFELAMRSIAFDISNGSGAEVFKAFAFINEKYIPGLAFTTGAVLSGSNGEDNKLISCGFLQLIDSSSAESEEILITEEAVKEGVVLLPCDQYNADTTFVLDLKTDLPSFSGIYGEFYFSYKQTSDHSVSVDVKPNERRHYNENIDLYDFNNERYVFKADLTYQSIGAVEFYSKEQRAMATARDAVNKLIDLQNSNGFRSEISTVVLFTEEAIEAYMLGEQIGTINGFSIDEINALELKENQIVLVTADGVEIHTLFDETTLAEGRATNGLITFIANLLLVGGTIIATICTHGMAMPAALSVISTVASTGSILYGLSNLAEGAQDLYYGLKGDITSEASNPLLEMFELMIDDKDTALKAYHATGLTMSLANAFTVPAGAAINLSHATGATFMRTALNVGRAVLVEAGKMAVTGIIAGGVGLATDLLVTRLTADENLSKLASFASALIAGAFSYKALQTIDYRYNLSGLHSKTQLKIAKPGTQSKEDIVKSFSEDRWASLSADQKKDAINRLSQCIADDLGIADKPRIRYYNNDSRGAGYGYFDDGDYTININTHYLDDGVELIDTLSHEYRHCWQYNNLGNDAVSRSYINYISYDPKLNNFDAYSNQACEVDAQNYGELWKSFLKGLFK